MQFHLTGINLAKYVVNSYNNFENCIISMPYVFYIRRNKLYYLCMIIFVSDIIPVSSVMDVEYFRIQKISCM